MDRVLVTGGAGFIGSHLVDSLVDLGGDVLVVDDFSRGRREHLDRAGSTGRLTLIEGDVRSAEDLRPVRDFAPDAVFHMAAVHHIPYCNLHPQEALDVNVLGLDAVIRAVRHAPLRTFVFASSGAVYGFGSDPWPETARARPGEVYSISKWMGEQVMARFHLDRPKVRTVLARIFNVYGPRETNPHVLVDTLTCLKAGTIIELGNLWPKRDLIFVTDVVAGLVATVAGGPRLTAFNIGTGQGTAIQDVLRSIEAIRGSPLDVRQVLSRMRDDDGHLISDPGKLMETGWKPENDLNGGLRRLLEWEDLL
ncbi:MAG TPA: NAD-dependent epimerase/dehydratase family protein [Streptosporangiaceae bacterium]|nr:NAD-dependent epimerase/dehydratase family protein [Streptosporangiaceae bacterium]